MILDQLLPIVLAPLGGGPSTPELAAAVTNAGGLGFLAGGYLSPDELGARIRAVRGLTRGALAVNLFAPGEGPSDPERYGAFVERLARWAQAAEVELGVPRYSDDGWEAKVELLSRERVEVVSFTFGCPDREVLDSLRSVGSEVWVTVTSPAEAREAEEAGADVLVVQGAEAGGHRGSFQDRPELPLYGLLPLLGLLRAASSLPLVASGGIATGAALAAVLCAGARGAQLGTVFMLAPEAGTSDAHRAALRSAGETTMTRAFTGRLARGIHNRFISEHSADAPIAYPELHYVTAPMRKRARSLGDRELINLWAGEAHELALELPAGEIVARLAADAGSALQSAQLQSAQRLVAGPGQADQASRSSGERGP